jgi:hypothetical protein
MTVRFLALDQQGILHLWLLPESYLVVCMTNGIRPGGQWSSVKSRKRKMSLRAYTCGLEGFGLI